jgi:NAD-dependent DNA ligase
MNGEPDKPRRTYKKREKIDFPDNSTKEVKPRRTYKKKQPIKKEIIQETMLSKPSSNSPLPRLNEKFAELMTVLSYVMRTRKDFMRMKAYDNARDTISNFIGDITTPEQLKGQKGIGSAIYSKLIDYEKTGTLRVLEEEKELITKKKAMDVFKDIYGVGEKKAEELIEKGITTLSELENRKSEVLNDKQIIGLKYYNDILQRIPRSEIEDYKKVFENVFPKNDENAKFEIVGSYRRGLSSSGDIDVIITSNDPSVFQAFIDKLIEKGVILEVLSRGNSKCLVIAKLSGTEYVRRIDFLYTTPEEFPFSILYFTGSKGFNTTMREYALSMKYTLNEHGLSVMEGKKKGGLVDQKFTDEKSIFDFLGLEYKKPEERIDGRDIILKKSEPQSEPPIIKIRKTVKKRIVIKPPLENERIDTTTVCKNISNPSVFNFVESFKKDGIKVLESLSEKQLSEMVDAANNAFHCEGKPIMLDNEYDILYEFTQKKYPKNNVLQNVGGIVEKNKVKLPYEMASMDKIKPDAGILPNWMKKYTGPYTLSCKLDGVSGLYSTEGDTPKLYTRGDGKVGQDISHMIPYLRLPKDKNIVIRGEFIIPKQIFKIKYEEKFANPRNLVAGIVNQKTVGEKVEDIHFVAYEVIVPENLTPSQQMERLSKMDIEVVQNMTLTSISNESLSEVLQNWRKTYLYEIDGVIVIDDKVYPRASGNPKHAFAFKMVLSDQVAEAHVVDVIWTASKDGYLKPRVQILPIKLGGVTIQYATGFNAAFISENKIGIGAIIQLIRSGDVIPYIKSVITPAREPKMPDVEYVWNDTHIDILLKDLSQDETVLEKNIAGFFKGIEVDGLGPGNVSKLVKAGYNTIPKIIHMKKSDFLKVDGFQEATATKLSEGIREKLEKASLAKIMAASNMFGRGFSDIKIELILKEYPNVLKEGERNVKKLAEIKGMATKTAESFVEHIPMFLEFMKECGLEYKLNIDPPTKIELDKAHPLYDKTIVMSGFRDKNIEIKLNQVGAKVGATVNKNTFILVVKDKTETTGKIEQANKLGISIMEIDEFMNQYFA